MRKQGFTLIELMIVVVIIGILAAIAIPNFQRMREAARDARVKNIGHTVQLVAEDYAVQHNGVYSATAADLQPLLAGAALLENPHTREFTEPQFSAPAATIGQVGIVVVARDGVNVGYVVNGWSKEAELFLLTNGN